MARAVSATLDLRAAAVAGLAGGAAYVATMEVDNRLSGMRLDDLKLLGRPFVRKPEHAKSAGVPIHFTNSVILAVLYAALAHDRLPGPPWLRGVLFANVENSLLYPLAMLEHRHPGIRDGQLDRYFSLKAYLLSIPRHITYGATVATVYDRLRRP